MRVPYSSFYSRYHKIFCELGYPELDIRFVSSADKKKRIWGHETGEWCIIEMLNSPVIPHLCQWRDVYSGFKNKEINRGFIEKRVHEIDTKRKEIWEREEAKTKRAIAEREAAEAYYADSAARKTKAIMQNPDLANRVAKHGLSEIDPYAIYKRIPHYRW